MNINKSATIILAAMTAVFAFGEEAAMTVVTKEANAVGDVLAAIDGEEPKQEAAEAKDEEVEVPAAGEDVPDAGDNEVEGITITDANNPDKITVSLDAVELEDVIRLFTRLSRANIICNTTNLHGTVTANLEDIAWKPALKSILRQQGLALIEDEMTPGVYEIGPKPAKGQEPFVTKSFKLSYLKAAEAQKILTNFLGLNGKDAQKKVSRDKDGRVIEEVEAVANEQKGYVVSYPAANTVVVSCRGENRMREVEQVISNLDVARQQVYIEAKIVQVSGAASKKIGIDWSFLDGYQLTAGPLSRRYTRSDNRNNGTSSSTVEGSTIHNKYYGNSESGSADASIEYPASLQDGSPSPWKSLLQVDQLGTAGMADHPATWSSSSSASTKYNDSAVNDVRTAIFDASAMSLAISALQTSDDVAQISNPKLIVANEERAIIDMTTKDPYVKVTKTQEGTGADAQITYTTSMDAIPVPTGDKKDVSYIEGAFFSYGIEVDVTPRINNSSNITVVIEPTLSELVSYYEPAAGLTRYPKISSKSVKTTFSLGNGQTAVIGGLTSTSDREVVKKVPILGSIPLLKYFFSHTEKVKEQYETIIFVTVGIVNPDDKSTTMGLPDGARLVQKRIDENGKIIDKKFEDLEKDEEPAATTAVLDANQKEIEEAKAEGVVVPEAVED